MHAFDRWTIDLVVCSKKMWIRSSDQHQLSEFVILCAFHWDHFLYRLKCTWNQYNALSMLSRLYEASVRLVIILSEVVNARIFIPNQDCLWPKSLHQHKHTHIRNRHLITNAYLTLWLHEIYVTIWLAGFQIGPSPLIFICYIWEEKRVIHTQTISTMQMHFTVVWPNWSGSKMPIATATTTMKKSMCTYCAGVSYSHFFQIECCVCFFLHTRPICLVFFCVHPFPNHSVQHSQIIFIKLFY